MRASIRREAVVYFVSEGNVMRLFGTRRLAMTDIFGEANRFGRNMPIEGLMWFVLFLSSIREHFTKEAGRKGKARFTRRG